MSRRVKITSVDSDEQLWDQWYQMLMLLGQANDKQVAASRKMFDNNITKTIVTEEPKKRGRPKGSINKPKKGMKNAETRV